MFKDMAECINKTYKTSEKQHKIRENDKNKNKAAKKCCGSDYIDSAR